MPVNIKFGPDKNGDGIDDCYVLDALNTSERKRRDLFIFDGQTGASLAVYPLPFVTWDFDFGADGNGDGQPELLLIDSTGIYRIDGKSGNFIDHYTNPLFGGGLENASSLTFGPDGHAYVADLGTNSVIRFDGFPTISASISLDEGNPGFTPTSTSTRVGIGRIIDLRNSNESGEGSLREGIKKANVEVDDSKRTAIPDRLPVTIVNRIPGTGPHKIVLNTRLPAIIGSWITLDGRDSTGHPGIIIDGSQLQNADDGLTLEGGNARLRGLIIQNMPRHGIVLKNKGGNVIEHSIIGTNFEGSENLGNSGAGIYVENLGTNIIGEGLIGIGNTIAFNKEGGIVIKNGTSNYIHHNSIFANVGLGIDLGGDGHTENDMDDSDIGPNNLQNYPETQEVEIMSGNITLTYSVPSDPAHSLYPINVDFFIADSTGEQGQTYIWTETIYQENQNSLKTITFAPALMVNENDQIVATATDASGNTSEFYVPKVSTATSVVSSFIGFSFPQNFPNPFQGTTQIKYTLPITSFVRVSIYNAVGQQVSELVQEKQRPGDYFVTWDTIGKSARRLTAGIYYCRMEITSDAKAGGQYVQYLKMILIR